MPGVSGMVKVVNVGDQTFTDMFESSPFSLEPGEEQFVQFEAASLWFGNPELMDVGPRQRARFETYKRLRSRYGAFDDDVEDPETGRMTHISADERWEANKPRVEVYTLQGERLWTVVDDPLGEHVNPAAISSAENNLVLNRLQALEEETRILRSALESAKASGYEVPSDIDVAGQDAVDDQPTGPISVPEPTFLGADEDMEDSPSRPGVQNP